MLGGGVITILAKNRQQAEDILFEMTTADLVSNADFSDGLELMSIENY
jgi:hypothetical protein